ncbi:MAG: DNA repair protein RecN [Desulfuromonadales bacterium]|nr:DNA repair protein RecN [Desulfuromonadales bacterium]
MLTDLSITNVAIIDSLHLSFRSGLTILTGETGAGKSIIIDAVGLIMGDRASAELIRSGADEAVVEALFNISGLPEVGQLLEESGFEQGSELLIKRSISRSGKNRIFINGGMATLALLTDISRRLINIYGQHESQTLLRPENQLQRLDAFAGTVAQREAFATLYRTLQELRERLERIDEQERELSRKLDLLSFQSQEIAQAELRSGEEEELEEQRQLLANAEKLATTTAEAFDLLYGGDGALLGSLKRISTSIRDVACIDHSLGDLSASLETAFLQLEDVAIGLRSYTSRVEADPLSLQRVEDRLDQINRLKRKYGATIADILVFKEQVDGELEQLLGHQQDRQTLQVECDRLAKELQIRGAELTERRTAAAGELKQALEREARQLAMKNAVIEVALTVLGEARPSGFERIELLFSPNPGEPPRPLAKIASGGELSRLMLAFKQVLPEGDVPTLVFDEVDSGIGGATSETVGRKLKKVACRQQVLCITHLPQVAVFADHHLQVEKRIDNGRTATTVIPLDGASRIHEVSRMLGGAVITDTTRRHAGEMLAAAKAPAP